MKEHVDGLGAILISGANSSSSLSQVTVAQASDTDVSNGRVLIEYGDTASPALNTDLTAEVTRNGGSNWGAATLSVVTSYSQGGRKVAETADTACTSGTAPQRLTEAAKITRTTIYPSNEP